MKSGSRNDQEKNFFTGVADGIGRKYVKVRNKNATFRPPEESLINYLCRLRGLEICVEAEEAEAGIE